MVTTITCATVYTVRSPEEIEESKEYMGPVPESLLVIPKFNGKDTIPIFVYGGSTSFILYNNGKIKYTVRKTFNLHFTRSAYMNISEIQDFILGLNQLGFFEITQERIIQKKYVRHNLACCLVPFINYYTPAGVQHGAGSIGRRRECIFHAHMIEVRLAGIGRYISYYNIEDDLKTCPQFTELQVLKKSIDYIDNFIFWKIREFDED